ncbi:MAG TPA: amidohydrolase [Ilumatobacteraceae bacterium]|nr:amidohydrolase [Ilumatobacteraceae bacterium]
MAEVLVTGQIFTADLEQPFAEAMLVRDATIVAIGDRRDVEDLATPGAKRHDSDDGLVLPGFIDAHCHLLSMGAHLDRCQLHRARALGDVHAAISTWATGNPDAPRVLGSGWLFSAVPGGRPTRQMLDEVVSDRPVYLDANDLHSVWVNSRALAELAIDDLTPDPIGGRIVRDAAGVATGLLLENAGYKLAWPRMLESDSGTRDSWFARASSAYQQAGTTTVVDMGFDHDALATIRRSFEREPAGLRVIAHWLINRSGEPREELAQIEEAIELARADHGHDITIAGIKLILDGTIDGCTACLRQPYSNGQVGELIWDPAALEPVVLAADRAGLQIAMHAIGDLAVATAIDALELASRDRERRGDNTERRHRIEHLEYVEPEDVARLHAAGVTASMQPVHCDPSIMPNWEAMLGPERAARGFAWPEYARARVPIAFGTDAPTAPHRALPNMYIATTRRSPSDPTLAPHRPDFSLSMTDAIGHATRDAAWASFREGQIGTLRVGHSADFITIDRNPFRDGPEALLESQVLQTVRNGRTIFSR